MPCISLQRKWVHGDPIQHPPGEHVVPAWVLDRRDCTSLDVNLYDCQRCLLVTVPTGLASRLPVQQWAGPAPNLGQLQPAHDGLLQLQLTPGNRPQLSSSCVRHCIVHAIGQLASPAAAA